MNTTAILARLETLQQELNALEAQLTSSSPADQALLDDEWMHLTTEMDTLCAMLWNDEEDIRGCEQCSGCAYCDEGMGYDPNGEI